MGINKNHKISWGHSEQHLPKEDIVPTSLRKGQASHSGLSLSLDKNFHLDSGKACFLFGFSTKQLISSAKTIQELRMCWVLNFLLWSHKGSVLLLAPALEGLGDFLFCSIRTFHGQTCSWPNTRNNPDSVRTSPKGVVDNVIVFCLPVWEVQLSAFLLQLSCWNQGCVCSLYC